MKLQNEDGTPFEFKGIPQEQMEKMIFEIKAVVDRYFPDSAVNGVAGLLYAFDATLDAHIQAGIFSSSIRDVFADQIANSGFRESEEKYEQKYPSGN